MSRGEAPVVSRRARLLGVGLAAFVLGVAWFAAGSLRGESLPSATTTTILPFAIAGDDATFAFAEPLEWREVAELGPFVVSGQAVIGDRMFIYGWEESADRLVAMTSVDGRTWDRSVIDPGPGPLVHGIGDGVVAPSRPSDGPLVIWLSRDGLAFDPLEVPTGETEPGWHIDTAAVRGDTVLVAAQRQRDPLLAINDRLPERFRDSGESRHYSVGFEGPQYRVVVHGPLGITLWSASAEDLGMSENELADLFHHPTADDGTYLFVTNDGATWAETFLPFTWFHGIDISDDARFIAAGSTDTGSKTWSSADGLNWTSESAYDSIDRILKWDSEWIGTRYRGTGSQLIRSQDATEWEEIDLDLLLPPERSWYLAPIVGGSSGIAVLAHSFDDLRFDESPPPIELSRNGFELTADDTLGTIRLTRDTIETHRIAMWSRVPPRDVAVDFDRETMTFLDPDTSEALVTFSFAELTAADEARWNLSPDTARSALLFSADGVAWSHNDATQTFGVTQRVLTVIMNDTTLVAVVGQIESGNSVDRVAIWAAALP